MNPIIRKLISFSPAFIKDIGRVVRDGVLSLTHMGSEVECPICGSEYRVFASFGNPKRINAKCINCGSLERHRLMWLYLNEKTELLTGKRSLRLLHFAPQRMFYDRFCNHPMIDYVPCDLFPEIYKSDGECEIVKVDITDIPFDNESFDVILCSHVLEHIPDDLEAMNELKRVMHKDGWGIFQVPLSYNRSKTYEDFSITSDREREKAFGQYDHVRIYGRDYIERLESVGLKVKPDIFVKSFDTDTSYRFGLMSKEVIHFCTK